MGKTTLHIFFLFFLVTFVSKVEAQSFPFQNKTLSDEERLDNLLSLMTIDEKVQALSTNLGVPRLGIRNTGHSEGLHGLALGGPGNWGGGGQTYQTFPTTTFPQAYGLGHTWDRKLIQKIADQEATEVRFYTQHPRYGKGGLVVRAPNADLARDPRWGRTEESFGEDPYLTGELTVAFVKGLQGNHPRYWKTASLMKHFLANSNEDGRDSTSSDFNDRLFHEYYAYPFYKGIKEGNSRAFMASYNAWNGIPMTVHPSLTEITRNQWGNNGIICTDGGALALLINAHKHYPTLTEGAAAVVKAGIGQFLDNYRPYIYEALNEGLLKETDIDKAIRGNFYVALRLGLLDSDQTQVPYTEIGVTDIEEPWLSPKTHQFVREVTAKSAVLLKNKGILPIGKHTIKSIAVIGPYSDEVLLDWYSGTPPYTVSILQGIKNAVGNDIQVFHANTNQADQAVKIAQQADVAIVCIGNHVYGTDIRWKYSPVPSDGREAVDRKSLSLEWEDLARVVYKSNPNTILLLVSSFPYAINWSQENLPAILHITHNSQELGNGVADTLFGNYNPAGRTIQTWVTAIDELPPMMDYDITNGRTYMYYKGKPLYPFGHGLSYTTFDYSNLQISARTISPAEEFTVSFDVRNSGKRDGEEVVQVYVTYPDSKIIRPQKQLKGFERIFIKADETHRVNIPIKVKELSYWDSEKNQFIVEPGRINLWIGNSSESIHLRSSIRIQSTR
ncbi:MAG: glycoside hydrolase family 3 C-terminal domain-containing protein [Bacteroides sp.]|nr:glycoside hydrolase family 3 C-terminal domain-containing protein [Bacteroides sp.]